MRRTKLGFTINREAALMFRQRVKFWLSPKAGAGEISASCYYFSTATLRDYWAAVDLITHSWRPTNCSFLFFFSPKKIPFPLYKSTQIQVHYEKRHLGSVSSAFASFGSNSPRAILDNLPFVMSQIKRWFPLNSSRTHSVSLEERQKKHRAQFVWPSATE